MQFAGVLTMLAVARAPEAFIFYLCLQLQFECAVSGNLMTGFEMLGQDEALAWLKGTLLLQVQPECAG